MPDLKAPGPKLAREVYGRIREWILAGDLPPGSPLSRRRLAERLGVSALPVGAALERLEVEGIVESRARAGTRVRVPSAGQIRGNYILREALETQAARLFAAAATAAERRALLNAAVRLDRLYAALAANGEPPHADQARAEKIHIEFHLRIARGARCPELVEAIERSRVLLFNWLFTRSGPFVPLPPRWHGDLAEALASGGTAAADAAMRAHVSFRRDEVLAWFRRVRSTAALDGPMQRGPQRRNGREL